MEIKNLHQSVALRTTEIMYASSCLLHKSNYSYNFVLLRCLEGFITISSSLAICPKQVLQTWAALGIVSRHTSSPSQLIQDSVFLKM